MDTSSTSPREGAKRLILFEGRIATRTGDVLHATCLYERSHEHLLMLESFRERVEESAAYPGAREWVIKLLPSVAVFYIESDVVRVVVAMHTRRKNPVDRDGKY